MISPKVQDTINNQINAELYSAYLYCAMAAYFQDQNLPGFAQWMKVQSSEEVTHADKFFDYLNERGGRVKLAAIDAPPAEWDSPLAAFQAAYEHETKVTGMINAMMDVAVSESDHATASFLKWYVDEQVEEEASAEEVVQKLKRIQDAPGGLFMMDRELGARQPGGA
ncbi:MAG: ferritin [Planctomycetota bacterium]